MDGAKPYGLVDGGCVTVSSFRGDPDTLSRAELLRLATPEVQRASVKELSACRVTQ